MNSYARAGASAFWEAALISALDVGISFAATLIVGFVFTDVLGTIFLAEGAVLLLVGGALGFAGQPGIRKVGQFMGVLGFVKSGKKEGSIDERAEVKEIDVRAAFYMLTGISLFVESLLLAVLV